MYVLSFVHSGVKVFQVTQNVYSRFYLPLVSVVHERVYPVIYSTLV